MFIDHTIDGTCIITGDATVEIMIAMYHTNKVYQWLDITTVCIQTLHDTLDHEMNFIMVQTWLLFLLRHACSSYIGNVTDNAVNIAHMKGR